MISKFTDWIHRVLKVLPHPIRWVLVVVLGMILVLIGIAFLVLPGPGIPFIIAGLAILSLEFIWAQEAVKRGEQWLEQMIHRATALFRKSKG